MKNIFALSTIMMFSLVGYTQRDKEFQIRLGAGAAAYATETKITATILTPFGNYPFAMNDTDGAATVHLPIELRYEIIQRLNVGLDMKFGSYLYSDSTDNTGKSNVFRVIGIAGEFTALNKPNTRLYVGFGLNTCVLEMKEKIVVGGTSADHTMRWRGPGVKLNLGFMQYFGSSPLGINFNIGWDSHNFDLKNWNYPTGWNFTYDGSLKTAGIDLAAGLVFRIRQ